MDEALDFYSKRSERAAKNFTETLVKHYRNLQEAPYFRILYGNVRHLPMRKFPYTILFRIIEKNAEIEILSVFCTHQNPDNYP